MTGPVDAREHQPLDWPADARPLLPFAPLLYIAWADGVLSPDEVRAIRGRIERTSLDEACRASLARWLNPARPPEVEELRSLLALLRAQADRLPHGERASLVALGRQLARMQDGTASQEVEQALSELAHSLSIPAHEALRELLAEPQQPQPARIPATPATFDPLALNAYLDGDHHELRHRVLALLSLPEFRMDPGWSSAEHRERVWEWMQRLAAEGLGGLGFPEAYGGAGDLSAAIAVFETLSYHDLSLTVEFGVNFGLFGGSVLQLGTARHHERYLHDIVEMRLPGCFAMTEIGHGSNVRDLETRAVYDEAAREFVIDSPTPSATKDWIGNAALHGRMATVFAQLEVRGESQGVHAFLVPLRDASGRASSGVTIEDCGLKQGLNGVDNGRIRFTGVRIPRENLLNRFADVSESGEYSSPIASESRRFFTMLGTLVAGRISIACASLSAAKVGLTIAIRYSARRRQFGPAGEPETPILDFGAQQRLLFPRLAQAYALDFALKDVVSRYVAHQSSAETAAGDAGSREIETLAAGVKTYASRHAIETLQAVREACGGQGYLASNRVPALKADTDVFATFEGANVVLLQLVAKELLGEYAAAFGDMKLWDVARYLADRATTRVTELNPVLVRRTDADHLRDADFQIAALRYREERMLSSLARRLKRRIDDGADSFTALSQVQDHVLGLGRAHVERVILERFAVGVEACADPSLRNAMTPLRQLFALWTLERNRAWYIEAGYFESSKSRAVREQVDVLCTDLRDSAVPLVDAFGVPAALLPAIAGVAP